MAKPQPKGASQPAAKPVPKRMPPSAPLVAEQMSVGARIRGGVLALVLATALGLAVRLLGFGELTVVMVLALAGIVLATISLTAFVNMWVGIPALIVMVTPPFAATLVVDVPVVGPIVETSVATAPQSPWAAGYRLTDATLRTDLAATFTTVRQGRRGAQFYDTFTVAPVVGAGWQRGDPVAVWALASGRAQPPEWAQPGCCLVRLLANEKHDEVVDRAMRRLGLGAVPDSVIGRWVADPARARSLAWGQLVMILGGACVAWTVLSVLAGLASPPRSRPPRAEGTTR
jgi:hypothetical protein